MCRPTAQGRSNSLKAYRLQREGALLVDIRPHFNRPAAAGLLDDVPHEIEWSTFTSRSPLPEAVSAGGADIGRVGDTPPIFASSHGSVKGDATLVAADSGLREVAGLRGKTMGVAKGSSAQGQVLLNLRSAGLPARDVSLSYLQPADASARSGWLVRRRE